MHRTKRKWLKMLMTVFISVLFLLPLVPNAVAHAGGDPFPSAVQKVAANPGNYNINMGKNVGGGGSTSLGSVWSAMSGQGSSFFGISTKSTYSTNYDALMTSGGTGPLQGEAAKFGRTLYKQGLDHTTSQGFILSIMTEIFRGILGSMYMLALGLNYIVTLVFNAMTTVMKFMNPFSYLSGDSNLPGNNVMAPMIKELQNAMDEARGIGMISVALTLAFGLFFSILRKRWSGGGLQQDSMTGGLMHTLWTTVKKLFQVVFLPFALMLLFLVFIDIVGSTMSNQSQNSVAQYATYSTFVDDQNWILHSRLAIPQEVVLTDSANPGPVTRTDALYINAYGAGISSAASVLNASGLTNNRNNPYSQKTYSTGKSSINGIDTTALDMLMRWTSSSEFTPSQWSAYARGAMPRGSNTQASSSFLGDLGHILNGDESSSSKTQEINLLEKSPNGAGGVGTSNQDYPYVHNGSLDVEPYGKDADGKDQYRFINTPDVLKGSVGYGDMGSMNRGGGLSTLGMYNYLSSTFTDDSVLFTNTKVLLSLSGSPIHYSVSLTNKGIGAFGNYVLSIVLMLLAGLIGMACIFSMILSFGTGIPEIISYTFISTVGIGKGMILLVQKFVSMVMEISIIFVIYLLATMVLRGMAGMPDILSGQNANLVTAMAVPKFSGNVVTASSSDMNSNIGMTGYGFLQIFIALVMVLMIVALWKGKGTIIKQIRDMAKKMVNNLLSGDNSHTNRPENNSSTNVSLNNVSFNSQGNPSGAVGEKSGNNGNAPATKDGSNNGDTPNGENAGDGRRDITDSATEGSGDQSDDTTNNNENKMLGNQSNNRLSNLLNNNKDKSTMRIGSGNALGKAATGAALGVGAVGAAGQSVSHNRSLNTANNHQNGLSQNQQFDNNGQPLNNSYSGNQYDGNGFDTNYDNNTQTDDNQYQAGDINSDSALNNDYATNPDMDNDGYATDTTGLDNTTTLNSDYSQNMDTANTTQANTSNLNQHGQSSNYQQGGNMHQQNDAMNRSHLNSNQHSPQMTNSRQGDMNTQMAQSQLSNQALQQYSQNADNALNRTNQLNNASNQMNNASNQMNHTANNGSQLNNNSLRGTNNVNNTVGHTTNANPTVNSSNSMQGGSVTQNRGLSPTSRLNNANVKGAVQSANQGVRSSQAKLNSAQQNLSHAKQQAGGRPTPQLKAAQQRYNSAKINLVSARNHAAQVHGQLPINSSLAKNNVVSQNGKLTKGQVTNNSQGRAILQNVGKAQTNLLHAQQQGNPQAMRQAKSQLVSANQAADSAGFKSSAYNMPSSVKQSLQTISGDLKNGLSGNLTNTNIAADIPDSTKVNASMFNTSNQLTSHSTGNTHQTISSMNSLSHSRDTDTIGR